MLSIWIFTQVLCWEYYIKPKNLVDIQFIKYPNYEFKSWKKMKSIKIIWVFPQTLTHDNYEKANGVQLDFFHTSSMLGILQQTEGLSGHKFNQSP